jgi:hypothetical protein
MVKALLKMGGVVGIGLAISGCSNISPTQISSSNGDQLKQIGLISAPSSVATPSTNQRWPAMAASVANPGYAEMVRVRTSDMTLEHSWWMPGRTWWETTPGTFGTNCVSEPALCVGHDGLLQVVVREGADPTKMQHYWRNWDAVQQKWVWNKTSPVCPKFVNGGLAILCNNQSPYNLEVIAYDGGRLKHMYRTPQGSGWVWTETAYLPMMNSTAIVSSAPSFGQTPDGNFWVMASVFDYNTSAYYYQLWKRYFNAGSGQWVWERRDLDMLNNAINNETPMVIPKDNNTIECIVKRTGSPYSRGLQFLKRVGSGGLTSDYWVYPSAVNQDYRMTGATFLNGSEIHFIFSLYQNTTSLIDNEHWKAVP